VEGSRRSKFITGNFGAVLVMTPNKTLLRFARNAIGQSTSGVYATNRQNPNRPAWRPRWNDGEGRARGAGEGQMERNVKMSDSSSSAISRVFHES
jgi:hypothetical protein